MLLLALDFYDTSRVYTYEDVQYFVFSTVHLAYLVAGKGLEPSTFRL